MMMKGNIEKKRKVNPYNVKSESPQKNEDWKRRSKIIILVGTDAISGGIFIDSPALNRKFIDEHNIDLYVPGNPAHPLTFINGVMDMMGIR